VNPVAYGGDTTLQWSSADASTFYINNIGYVTANESGSALKSGNTATTNYDGTVVGSEGTVVCSFTLVVNAPMSCSWDGGTVAHDASVTAYESESVAYGSLCSAVAETRLCSDGTLSGSYEYASCVEDGPPPSCTPSYTCAGDDVVYTDEVCEPTPIATCEAPEFCVAGSAVCLYVAPTGDITASPRLVRSGATSQISWEVADAEACTVSGNGDTWVGTSGLQISNAISQATTFTLVCDDADEDAVEDDYTASVTVYRVPGWLEF
jgi:hypothetical protein